MKHFLFIIHLLLASAVVAAPAPPVMGPYSPNLFQDKRGNEWYIEANGGLQRNGSVPTLIAGAMSLQIANQQFYCQQPMSTPDGKEILMTSPQAMNGITVSRRITVMDRDGGLRYVEQFTNTTNRDLTTTVEIRHTLNSQSKGFISNTGRPLKDALQADESGVVLTPSANEKSAPALLFTLRAAGSSALPRISIRNGYQLSVFYNLTIPAGQSAVLVHAIAQVKLSAGGKPEDMAKAFQPFTMVRLTRDLPRATLKLAANLQGAGNGAGLDDWLPGKYWGVTPENADVLILDDVSRVKGRASVSRAALTSTFGKCEIPWNKIAAIAGPGFTSTQQSWVWLRDGQRWKGAIEALGLKFTLTSGADLELTRLNRLILSNPPADKEQSQPSLTSALLETWLGERVAFTPAGNLDVATPWGSLSAPWTDVVRLASPAAEALGSTLHLHDGTRVRVLPIAKTVTLNTRSFGAQSFDLAQIRQAVTPLATKVTEDESESLSSFVDLVGDQRLVGRVTTANLRLLTQTGPVTLTPANIRELSPADDADGTPADESQRRFKAELWGGGTIVGSLEDAVIAVQGRGFAWEIPVRQLLRMVNPIPITDSTLMRRIGILIQELGDAQWQTRERSTRELREMGILAKMSLQEALKQSTDAEVIRRLEGLLAEME